MTALTTLLQNYISRFTAAGFEDAPREVAAVARAALEMDASAFLEARAAHKNLNAADTKKLDEWLAARLNHVPLARLRGTREFWGMDFILNEATLEPRPDSETLIEIVLKKVPDKGAPLRILDIATGSGCLLLALLSEYGQAHGVGTDISARALEAAQINAEKLGFSTRATFVKASWAEGIDGAFDIIISNPPYIRTEVIAKLEAEVKNHDPHVALDGGADGLVAYRALLPQAKALLKTGGFCAVEIGYDQGDAVKALFDENGFSECAIYPDLSGTPRVVVGRNQR